MGHSRPLFLYFRLFNTVDSKQMFNKSLPMPGFEPRISGVEGDRSTTKAQPMPVHQNVFMSPPRDRQDQAIVFTTPPLPSTLRR